MALVECKECKKEVSKEAKSCPHCGIQNPGMVPASPAAIRKTIGAIFLGLIFIIALVSIFSGPSEAEIAKSKADKRSGEAACQATLQCIGDKLGIDANVKCRPLLESQAKSIAKWDYKIGDDSFGEVLFSKFRWADETKQQVIYIGDKAKFQNGFGAWQRANYECLFDIATKKALFATFHEAN